MKRHISIVILVIISIIGITSILFVGCGHDKIEVSFNTIASTIPASKPHLKVYIENSGSMDGYMCDGSELKDAIYDYVSDLNRNTATTNLYYINSNIIPYSGNLTSYIKDLNPASFRKAGGNTANTDLGNILASILETVNDTTVSILISDCILDLPSKNAEKYLTNCQIRIKDEVINTMKRVPNLGVEILKLSSEFNGKYFYPNGEIEILKDVKRPYYIWIFGNKNYLAQLNSEVPVTELTRYNLNGIVAFTNETPIPFDISNNALTNKIIIPINGDYHITILADFRTTLQPDGIVQDKRNYSFNNSTLNLDGIYPISDTNSKYSHYIRFTIPQGTNITQDCLKFNAPKIPSWVSESNDDTGANIQDNINKTSGIKYLIQGVADAYKHDKIITEFKFNVKRN